MYVQELAGVGAMCNAYGFYSLTLGQGKYHIICSMIAFNANTTPIELNNNKKLDFAVSEDSRDLLEVVVSDIRPDDNITKPEMGVERLQISEVAKLPVIFGEKDILKTIQLLPGVKSAEKEVQDFPYVGAGPIKT